VVVGNSPADPASPVSPIVEDLEAGSMESSAVPSEPGYLGMPLLRETVHMKSERI
jgi:hypothetical protein